MVVFMNLRLAVIKHYCVVITICTMLIPQVRARTIKGYGSPASLNITLSLPAVTGGVVSETSAGGSSVTIGATSAVAGLGFVISIILLAVVIGVVWYNCHKHKDSRT